MSQNSDEMISEMIPFELALDKYNVYPMESVTLTIQASLGSLKNTLLCVHLPQNTSVEWVRLDGHADNTMRVYTGEYYGTLLSIPLNKILDVGSTCTIEICVRLSTLMMNHMLSFCVWMSSEIPDRKKKFFVEPDGSRSIEVSVKRNADYLNYLPEVYNYDDFINRFLMMFESFWKPMNQQISQVENYFDPNLTPDVFLEWLGSWVGMEIDSTFPKDRIRGLIKMAIPFFQSRGTANSLKLFLEMYSGGKVDIKERKAHNMTLGGAMGIGDGVALGMDNKPNTVIVSMKVPASELQRTGFSKAKYAAKIKAFIRNIVPAHTVFSLSCNFE